jgi:hypothetical protein
VASSYVDAVGTRTQVEQRMEELPWRPVALVERGTISNPFILASIAGACEVVY